MAIFLGSLREKILNLSLSRETVEQSCLQAGYRLHKIRPWNFSFRRAYKEARAWIGDDSVPTDVWERHYRDGTIRVVPVRDSYPTRVNTTLEGETLRVSYELIWPDITTYLRRGEEVPEDMVLRRLRELLVTKSYTISGVEGIGFDQYSQDWMMSGCAIDYFYFVTDEVKLINWLAALRGYTDCVYPEWTDKVQQLLSL